MHLHPPRDDGRPNRAVDPFRLVTAGINLQWLCVVEEVGECDHITRGEDQLGLSSGPAVDFNTVTSLNRISEIDDRYRGQCNAIERRVQETSIISTWSRQSSSLNPSIRRNGAGDITSGYCRSNLSRDCAHRITSWLRCSGRKHLVQNWSP